MLHFLGSELMTISEGVRKTYVRNESNSTRDEKTSLEGCVGTRKSRNFIREELTPWCTCKLRHPDRLRTAVMNTISYTPNYWIVYVCLLVTMMPPTIAVDVKLTSGRTYKFEGLGLRRSLHDGQHRDLQVNFLRDISPGLSQDASVLISWKNKSSTLNSAWLDNTTSGPCSWPGVECGLWQGENRVTTLNLPSLNLTGPVPAGISKLSGLRSLSFAYNNLIGSIPDEVGDCSNLQVLNFSHNMLADKIPVDLGRLVNLQILDLSWNRLNSTIPPELFTNCSSLTTFNISSNAMNGTIPIGLGNCKSLRSLDVGNNSFQGAIPPDLGQIPALETLILSDGGGFDGPIPDSIFSSCTNLQNLDLSWNQLSGGISAKLGNCRNLLSFNTQGNLLNGSIPAELGKLKGLQALTLGGNNLSGVLPQELSECSSLSLLDVSNNSFSGAVPIWLSRLPNLQFLTLHGNNLVGKIPVEITTIATLRYFDVSNNSLEGEILPQFGQATSLKFLRLSSNLFNGSIPTELGYLSGLQGLDLSSNLLTGTIPKSLGNLQDLLWLQLADNYLSGEIPEELTNCSSLLWINLAENNLTGTIPSRFGDMGQDADRVFQLNQQHPWMLDGLGECSILSTWAPGKSQQFERLLNLQDNRRCLTWLPMLIRGEFQLRSNRAGLNKVLGYWQLSLNYLTGSIPDLSSNNNLGFLIVSQNDLSGPIPDNISSLPLYNLNVSRNSLSGSIPSPLGNLSMMILLDMSYNNLSGSIPQELGALSDLTVFNISYNVNLSGPIPSKNQFTTLGVTPYVGDVNLCFDNSADSIYKNLLLNVSNWPLPGLCNAVPESSSTLAPSATPAHSPGHKKYVIKPVQIVLISIMCTLSALLLAWTGFCVASKWHSGWLGRVHKESVLLATTSGKETWVDRSSLQCPVASFGMPGLEALTYTHLLAATDNFSDENIVGDGGFGIVYKAKLKDGSTVAIKKLIQDGAQGAREFQAEMETLGMIKHDNLVSLLGYCCNNEEKLLVYEYLKNGSLDDWLYDDDDAKAAGLDWPRRLQIALGTAQGLAFLHHHCVHLIIHRDMKSSNILLNDDFKAYLTDFGMARIMDADSTHVSTIVAGTPGYVPPEYGQTWRATTKGDVYSFGVVMLELLSGKRPTGPHFNGLCGSNLVEMVRILWSEGRREEVCDPVVLRTASGLKEISEFLALGIRCTQISPTARPTMLEVSQILEDIIAGGALIPTNV